MKVFFDYNPYSMETNITINGKDIRDQHNLKDYSKIIERIKAKAPIQTWIRKTPYDEEWKGLLSELVDDTNEANFELSFKGRNFDYEYFKAAIDEQKNEKEDICVEFSGFYELDEEKMKNNIDTAIDRMVQEEFKHIVNNNPLASEGLKKAYKKFCEEYKKVQIKEFNIIFSGLFSSGKSTIINAIIRKNILPVDAATKTTKVCKIKHTKLEDKIIFKCFDKEKNAVLEKEFGSNNEKKIENEIEECSKQDEIDTIIIEMNLSHLYPTAKMENEFDIVLVDTPGINSAAGNCYKLTQKHIDITLNEITESDYNTIVFFVVSASENENETIGGFIETINQKMAGKDLYDANILNERFIFVNNKFDTVNFKSDQTIGYSCGLFLEYLNKISQHLEVGGVKSFINSNIYPTAASDIINEKGFRREEFEARLKRYGIALYCDEFAPLLKNQKEQIKKDCEDEVILHTGIPSIEFAIKSYIEGYAYPFAIKKMLDTFEPILKELRATLTNQLKKIESNKGSGKQKDADKSSEEKTKEEEEKSKNQIKEIKKIISKYRSQLDKIKVDEKSIAEIKDLQNKIDIEFEKVINESKIKKTRSKKEIEDFCSKKVSDIEKIWNDCIIIEKKSIKEYIDKNKKIFENFKAAVEDIADSLDEDDREWLRSTVFYDSKIYKFKIEKDFNAEHKDTRRIIENPDYSKLNFWQRLVNFFTREIPPNKESGIDYYEYTISEKTIESLKSKQELLTGALTGIKKDLINKPKKMKEHFGNCIIDVSEMLTEHNNKIREQKEKIRALNNDIEKITKETNEIKQQKSTVESIRELLVATIKEKGEKIND